MDELLQLLCKTEVLDLDKILRLVKSVKTAPAHFVIVYFFFIFTFKVRIIIYYTTINS